MAWHVEGRLCVVLHTRDQPTDSEWDAYLAAMRAHPRVRELRVLIRSLGGGPTGVQRQRLQRQVGNHPPPVAILTSTSVPMRGISTALKWYNDNVVAFQDFELNAACEHLGLSQFEVAAAGMCLARLERDLVNNRRQALA
jgi:hypothetical protein